MPSCISPHWYEVIRLSDATAADKWGSMVGFLVFMPILWGDPSIMFIFEPPKTVCSLMKSSRECEHGVACPCVTCYSLVTCSCHLLLTCHVPWLLWVPSRLIFLRFHAICHSPRVGFVKVLHILDCDMGCTSHIYR